MKKIYLLLITILCANLAFSQATLVAIDRANINPPFGPISPTAVATINSDISAQGFTRGSGVSKTGGNGDVFFQTKDWDATTYAEAISNNEYIELSVTLAPNFLATLNEFRIRLKRTSTGPKRFRVLYSLNNFSTPGIALQSAQNLTTSETDFTYAGSVNSGVGGKVTVRVYAWNATNADGELQIAGNTAWAEPYLAIANPGAIIIGTINYNGLTFQGTAWENDIAPDETTGGVNARILNGTYYVSSDVALKNINIGTNAYVVMNETGNLTINGNSANSGYLYMESTSTQYPSLIIKGSATGTYNYSRHVNRATTPSKRGNDLISAPVVGQNFQGFLANNVDKVYSNPTKTLYLFGRFNKVDGSYETWSSGETESLVAGIGYKAGSVNNDNFLFSGDVKTGNVSVYINKEVGQIGGFPEWNLIGNPYPSYIKLSDFLAININNLDNEAVGIYGYDGDASDGWTVWNQAYSDTHLNAVITPGQGFLVAAKLPINEVKFTPAMRTTGTSDDFILGRNATTTNSGFLKLNISNGERNYRTDIYFNDHSTKGLDIGYDASVFGKKAAEFAVYTQLIENNVGTDLAVQSLPYADLSTEIIIPLGINVAKGQRIVVSIAESTLPEGTEVYLEDNLNNSFTLLNNSDYIFTADSKLTDTGRFFLRTTNGTLSTPSTELNGLQIYANNANKTLFVKGLLKQNTSLNIYDVQGRLISSTQLKANTNRNQTDMSSLSSGIYVVELKNSSFVKTQKVILK